MKRFTIILIGAFLAVASVAVAQTVFKYKCPKCGFMAQYGSAPGNPPKCPTDGWSMMRQ